MVFTDISLQEFRTDLKICQNDTLRKLIVKHKSLFAKNFLQKPTVKQIYKQGMKNKFTIGARDENRTRDPCDIEDTH